MRLLVIGLNHKTAPVNVREQFAVSKDAVRKGLSHLAGYGAEEAVMLSTCNRSELYAVTDDDENALGDFLFDLTGAENDAAKYFYEKEGEDAIRHLFRVASGLDSLVLGEGQILSQVKEAYALSREAGATGTVLNTLFHRAIKTGKRVRTETRIDCNAVSVSYAAVELAKEKLGALDEKEALIFGAGKMAELTAKHLIAAGIKKIYVANRHIEKARELAKTFAGEAVSLETALSCAERADIIVTSTGAPHYVIKAWETRKLMTKRKGRKLFFIDIAVPRDVDPEVGEIKGVTLYNIDALNAVIDEHIEERQRAARAAEKIIDEEVSSIVTKFQYLSFRPLMALLSERAERIRAREVKRAGGKLPNLSEEEWRQVNHMTKMIVRKLLRAPMMKMNSAAGTKDEEFCARAMKTLFKLDTIGETNDEKKHRYRYARQ